MTIQRAAPQARRPRAPLPLLVAGLLTALLLFGAAEPLLADPPPWAPAHGWRAQQGEYGRQYQKQGKYKKYKKGKYKKYKKGKYKKYKKGKKHSRRRHDEPDLVYAPPIDFVRGRCQQEVLGTLLGGAAGAAVGAQVGKGDGNTVAIIGGTIIGLIVGGSIGRSMDEIDQNCVGQTLEHAGDGEAIHWNAQDDGARYQVTPVKTYQVEGGRYCREYTTTATVGGRVQETYGRACRQPDGTWQIVR